MLLAKQVGVPNIVVFLNNMYGANACSGTNSSGIQVTAARMICLTMLRPFQVVTIM